MIRELQADDNSNKDPFWVAEYERVEQRALSCLADAKLQGKRFQRSSRRKTSELQAGTGKSHQSSEVVERVRNRLNTNLKENAATTTEKAAADDKEWYTKEEFAQEIEKTYQSCMKDSCMKDFEVMQREFRNSDLPALEAQLREQKTKEESLKAETALLTAAIANAEAQAVTQAAAQPARLPSLSQLSPASRSILKSVSRHLPAIPDDELGPLVGCIAQLVISPQPAKRKGLVQRLMDRLRKARSTMRGNDTDRKRQSDKASSVLQRSQEPGRSKAAQTRIFF